MKSNPVSPFFALLIAMSLVSGFGVKAQGLSGEEQDFVKKAAGGGLAEVKLSELANDRAFDAKVKAFAGQMVTDHTQANNELKPIADSNKIPWPNKLEGESETIYNKLTKLSGAKFDAEYIKVMVQDHDKTVSAFEEASTKVKDPSLKAFTDKTLPVLRQHQEHVHELFKQGALRGNA
jgi:putative membrane protein